MAREGITFEQVAAAADALVGEGQQPTIRAIRERLGTGSPNTVHKHLTARREARPVAAAAAPELPQALTAAIAAEIERAAAQARAEIEGRLVQARGEAVELAAAGEVIEAERDALAEQVAELTRERDTLAGKAAASRRLGRPGAAHRARATGRRIGAGGAGHGPPQDRGTGRTADRAGRRDRAPTRRAGRCAAGPHRRRTAGRRAGRQTGGMR
ncbi:DNA-binding protein [Serratia marcescens]|uniref:DNA-binding protein n=1 Tax=Serratia marcescens TaxID=615 RepID=A0A939NMC5_SERMA|nr:DNA-binding protein [Serratia marcescens]